MIAAYRVALCVVFSVSAAGAQTLPSMPADAPPMPIEEPALPAPASAPAMDTAPAELPPPLPSAVPTIAAQPAPADATATPAAETVPAAAAGAVAAPEMLSFGNFPDSLLLTPAQEKMMRDALTAYETMTPAEQTRETVAPTVAKEPPAPQSYPVFVLDSIAYRNARDWTVWINGARITPRTNNQAVRVVAVRPDQASMEWTASYVVALRERERQKKFADTKPVAHKLTRPNRASFDIQSGIVRFTLRPNQSFAAGYMATFEGRVPSPALEPLAVPEQNAGEAAQPAVEPDMSRQTTVPEQTLEHESGGLGGDAIRRMYDRASTQPGNATPEENAQDSMDGVLQQQQ